MRINLTDQNLRLIQHDPPLRVTQRPPRDMPPELRHRANGPQPMIRTENNTVWLSHDSTTPGKVAHQHPPTWPALQALGRA
ncbi:hypothetical protein GCM10009554_09880 [Kribbella koreensis]|uniref:Uncharacterized protein n=1 Tax=Kribbella koreensis TaxID=57909 RepID=A0ABN1PHT1_9ACTN